MMIKSIDTSIAAPTMLAALPYWLLQLKHSFKMRLKKAWQKFLLRLCTKVKLLWLLQRNDKWEMRAVVMIPWCFSAVTHTLSLLLGHAKITKHLTSCCIELCVNFYVTKPDYWEAISAFCRCNSLQICMSKIPICKKTQMNRTVV